MPRSTPATPGARCSTGAAASSADDYGDFDIQILAEINHAPRLSHEEILGQAERLKADGADVIDIGCEPGDAWRVNLYRIDQYEGQQELYAWSPTLCETFHVPGRFGELVFEA